MTRPPFIPAPHWIGIFMLICATSMAAAQSESSRPAATDSTEQKVVQLSAAVAKVQAQMEANQKLLLDLQEQLATLQKQIVAETQETSAGALSAAVAEIQEQQAMDESQIAVHELTKVETASKYPLKVSGLILFNSFLNTRQVDVPAAPAYALYGTGSTGLSIRQTILGLDARGPHIFGATSHADVRVDFFGSGSTTGYTSGMLRLRTAHAGLTWPNTEITVELDRSLLAPHEPTSLLVIGQPQLAWAGNLWTWNPQVALTHRFQLSPSVQLITQAGLIDASDPRLPASVAPSGTTLAERSRIPGTEARVALQHSVVGTGAEFGIGGYYSPHRTRDGIGFNAWAASADLRVPLLRYFGLTANAYRGQGLGGLGGGGYVDYYYQYIGNTEYTRALDDVGGWAQLQANAGHRFQINSGFGIDNPFANEVHMSSVPFGAPYPGLARNRAYYGNVIYSPSAYFQLSLEYRHMWSNYAIGSTAQNDNIGIGAGYSF